MKNDLGIPTSKQVISFHNTVLQDDTLTILSIPGIVKGSHIKLKFIYDDDTVAQWTSVSNNSSSSSRRRRAKLMVMDKSIETMADTIDCVIFGQHSASLTAPAHATTCGAASTLAPALTLSFALHEYHLKFHVTQKQQRFYSHRSTAVLLTCPDSDIPRISG
ncbi:hypothetical protein ACFX15_010224 [Malus domestica]